VPEQYTHIDPQHQNIGCAPEFAPWSCGEDDDDDDPDAFCDNPPRKIPYYRLNQSTLVIK
jgi:hypothetical protein